MANSAAAPLSGRLRADVPAVATVGNDDTFPVGLVPYDATVTAVTFLADTVLTGANTNSRTLSLVNKGQDGTGTTVVATKAFVSGVNAVANDDTTITLSGTAANLLVASGDVLQWKSDHVGTGIADPGGVVLVDFARR